MARGKKPKDEAEQAAAPKQEKVKPSETKQVISQSALVNLIKAKRGAKKDTGEINGRVGQMIADAVENKHLHRKAFATIMQLDGMEPEKLADFLDNFDFYLDITGIRKRAESVMRMNLGEAAAEDEAPASNVAQFPTAGNA